MACVGALPGHGSTVSCLAFSPCGTMLASSGKDRSMCLYALRTPHQPKTSKKTSEKTSEKSSAKTSENNQNTDTTNDGADTDMCPFRLVEVQKGAHKRIVWDIAWADISHTQRDTQTHTDGQRHTDTQRDPDRYGLLMSASRDGTCKLWRIDKANDNDTNLDKDKANIDGDEKESQQMVCVRTFTPFGGVAVTALHFSTHHSLYTHGLMVALGAESGALCVWRVNKEGNEGCIGVVKEGGKGGSEGERGGNEGDCGDYGYSVEEVGVISDTHAHGATVKRLRWCPKVDEKEGDNVLYKLASCGEDNTVRIFNIQL